MSDMLQQAIIDATALKEAAVRNAETLVLEKYSNEIKDAVEVLLEQEATDDMGLDPAAAAADPAQEIEVVEDLPLASTSENLDEEIEIPLKNLMEELEKMTGSDSFSDELLEAISDLTDDDDELDIISEDLEAILDEQDIEEDIVDLTEEELAEIAEMLDEDIFGEEVTEEGLCGEGENTDEIKCGMREDLDEDLDQLEEALVVDIKPTKRGWAGRPDSDLELAEEELLALEQDSEYREKMAAMRKAVSKLEGLNESLTQENETLKQQLSEVKTQMSKIRNVANTLKENIDQTNLTNAKLLYQNKALNSDSMNERQKNKLVEALNNAETVEEAKVIFDTLENTVGSTSRKSQPKSLVEAVEKSSSIVYASRKQRLAEQKQPPAYDRWKFLAGIDKN
tara:strand:+ start:3716 stop:4903 length:1188 start_codon:yes stop_codon:yes gene_type:complete